MIKIYLPVAIACMIVTGVIGLGVGYYLTPEYRLSMYDKNVMDLRSPDRWLDQRYSNAMISHHRAAMLLAEQAQARSQRPEIKDLVTKILANEPAAIAELYAWKKDWYRDTRKVQDPAVARLGSYDEKFDLRFLNALIAHHEAGLVMTKEIKTKSSRTEILNNADAVETFLSTTEKLFKDWRKQWYNL